MPTISFSHCTIFYTSAGGARSREVRQILRYLVLGGYHVHSVSFVVYVWKSITPQIAYRVTAYRVDSAYTVGFTWNQIILGIYIVRTDLILGRYSVAYRVD